MWMKLGITAITCRHSGKHEVLIRNLFSILYTWSFTSNFLDSGSMAGMTFF